MFARNNPHRVRNIVLTVLLSVILLTGICILAYGVLFNNWFGLVQRTDQSSYAYDSGPATGTGNTVGQADNAIPYAQAETCTSWGVGETKVLKPGQSVAGDVMSVNNTGVKTQFFKSDIGGYELVRNTGKDDITIYAPFGAGCLMSTDLVTLVNGEAQNPNHTDLVYVHLITFTGYNQYTEQWYYSADLPLK